MFGRWGIPPGAYWMVPIVGPSGPRDLVGYVFDTALNLLPSVGAPLKLVNSRAIAGPQVDLAREASLDYYAFVRDAHLQRRRVLVADLDRAPAGEGEEGPVDEAARREENLLYEVEIDEETSSGE
jgi:phospholipid-binding lipoprotein MlaA